MDKRGGPVRKQPQRRRSNDRRAIRTRRALGMALVALMLEQRFDEITVEQILQRARVGRATFYTHYQDKRDLLLGDVDRLFDYLMSNFREHDPRERRIAPVAELFSHVSDARDFVQALEEAGLRNAMLDTITDHLAKRIEARLAQRRMAATSLSRPMMAQMFAATLVEMLDWWLHAAETPSAQEMDRQYHLIVGSWLDRLVPA